MQLLKSIIIALCLSIGDKASAVEVPPPEAVLQGYIRAVHLLDFSESRIHSVMNVSGAVGDEAITHTVRDGELIRRGEKIVARGKESNWIRKGDSKPVMVMEFELVVADKGMMFTTQPGKERALVFVIEDLAEARAQALSALGPSAVFDGYLPGNAGRPLTAMLEESSFEVRPQMENIDGHQTIVVEFNNEFGEHTLWLDPASDFQPRRIRVRKESEDLYDTRRLSEMESGPVTPASIFPSATLTGIDIVMDQVELKEIDGESIPMSGRLEETRRFDDGTAASMSWTFDRRAFRALKEKDGTGVENEPGTRPTTEQSFLPSRPNVASGFDEAVGTIPLSTVPDGTPVVFQNRSNGGVVLEWRDGKTVPKVNRAGVDSMAASAEQLRRSGAPPLARCVS